MIVRRVLPLVIVLILTSCSFFSRSQSRYYTLDRVAPTAPRPAAVRGATPVAIDAIELPPELDRKEVAVRKSGGELDVRSADQWSATFHDLVLHTLAFDLADRLPEGMTILPGEAKPLAPTRSIDVVFADLSAGPANTVTLDCRWTLHTPGHPDTTHSEHISIPVPNLDSGSVAAGVSQALGELSGRVAAGV